MNTLPTAIKDFKVGDSFTHYGAIFTVTGEVKTFNDGVEYYGRSCKMEKNYNPKSSIDGLLAGYDWMQGTGDVKYAKIV